MSDSRPGASAETSEDDNVEQFTTMEGTATSHQSVASAISSTTPVVRRRRGLRSKSVDEGKRIRSGSILPINKREFKPKNGWTSETETSCRKIAQESAINKWLHNRNASILSGANDRTTLAVAIISAINGLTGLTGFLTQNYAENLPWLLPAITIGGFLLALTATIISLIQRTYDFAGKIDRHKTAERAYNWLFFNIQGQLQKPVEKRQEGNSYFSWITHEISGISNSEDIDDQAVKDFYNTFPGGVIPGLDTLDELELNEDGDTPHGSSSGSHDESPLGRDINPATRSLTTLPISNPSESDLEKGISSSNLPRSPTRRPEKNQVKNFRAMKDANIMSIVSHHSPEKSIRYHNPDMMAYEMRRFAED